MIVIRYVENPLFLTEEQKKERMLEMYHSGKSYAQIAHHIGSTPEIVEKRIQRSIAEKRRPPDAELTAMQVFLETYLEEWHSRGGGRHIPSVIQTLSHFLQAFKQLYKTHQAEIDAAIDEYMQQIQLDAYQFDGWKVRARNALPIGLETKAAIREALQRQELYLRAGQVWYKGVSPRNLGIKTFRALVAWAYNDNESDDELGLEQREPSERNKAIAALRAKGLTYKAIGQQYGISGARVREILQAMQPTHGNGQGK